MEKGEQKSAADVSDRSKRPNLHIITDKNNILNPTFDEILHQLHEEHQRLVRSCSILEADNRSLRHMLTHRDITMSPVLIGGEGEASFPNGRLSLPLEPQIYVREPYSASMTGAKEPYSASMTGAKEPYSAGITGREPFSAGITASRDPMNSRRGDADLGRTSERTEKYHSEVNSPGILKRPEKQHRQSYILLRQATSRISNETLMAISDADEAELLPEWQRDSAVVRQLPAIFLSASRNQASRQLNMKAPMRMKMKTSSTVFVTPTFSGAPKCLLSDFLMSPTSRRRMLWDFAGILFLFFDFLWMPLQVFEPRRFLTIQTFDWMATIYWTCDILANCMTGYITHDGKVEKRCSAVLRRYILSGPFCMDFFIVAVDWLVAVLDATGSADDDTADNAGALRVGKFFRVMRIMRAFRLLRLRKLRHLLFLLQDHINSEIIFIFFNTAKNLGSIMAMNHIIACLWWLIGASDVGEGNWRGRYSMDKESMATQYLVSLHWSLTQFTPATMHVNPQNSVERTFTVCVIVIAMLSFSTFVSSITASMTRIRALQGSELSQYFMLRKFLRENNVSRDLSARVHRYINLAEQIHRRRIEIGKVELLNVLSGPLRVELQKELFAPHFEKHDFFRHYSQASNAAMSQLCYSATERRYVGRGDLLFSCASSSKFMGFLAKGCLLYQRPPGMRWSTRKYSTNHITPGHLAAYTARNKKRFIMVREGTWYCEACLWVPWVHHGTMAALIESEIITLNSDLFRQVALEHSQVFQECKNYAVAYLDHLQEWKQTHGRIWDMAQDVIFPDSAGGEVASVSSFAPAPETDEIKYAHLLEAFCEVEEESEDDSEYQSELSPQIAVDSAFLPEMRREETAQASAPGQGTPQGSLPSPCRSSPLEMMLPATSAASGATASVAGKSALTLTKPPNLCW